MTAGDPVGDVAGLAHVGGCAALTELRLEGNAELHSVPAALGAGAYTRSLLSST